MISMLKLPILLGMLHFIIACSVELIYKGANDALAFICVILVLILDLPTLLLIGAMSKLVYFLMNIAGIEQAAIPGNNGISWQIIAIGSIQWVILGVLWTKKKAKER